MAKVVAIVENTKIMPKGQVFLPSVIRERIGVSTGDSIALICESDRVTLMSSAVYAMQKLQIGMEAEWEKVGVYSDEDVMELVKEARNEIEGL